MRAFEQKLQELQLNQSELSEKLRKDIKEFVVAEKEYLELKSKLDTLDAEDEEYDELDNEVNEYEELLETTDNELVEKIQKYFDKKPYYDAKIQHMRNKAAEKKGLTPAPQAAAPQAAAPQAAAPQAIPVVGGQPIVEEKKKSGGGWIFWGILGVVGLAVGVNILKNRD